MRKRANVLLLSSVALLAAVDSADIIPKNSVVHNNRFKSQPRVPKIEKYRYDKTSLQELHSISNEGLELSASDQEYSGVVEQSKQQQTRRNGLFDDLDKQIFMTALPLSAIFAIFPLANAIDLFWVNRLGNTLAVAGQAAANQVYNSAFWLFSFLPSVTATLVSKSHAKGDLQGTQDAVCQALSLSILIGLFGASFMFFFPTKALGSILKGNCFFILLSEVIMLDSC